MGPPAPPKLAGQAVAALRKFDAAALFLVAEVLHDAAPERKGAYVRELLRASGEGLRFVECLTVRDPLFLLSFMTVFKELLESSYEAVRLLQQSPSAGVFLHNILAQPGAKPGPLHAAPMQYEALALAGLLFKAHHASFLARVVKAGVLDDLLAHIQLYARNKDNAFRAVDILTDILVSTPWEKEAWRPLGAPGAALQRAFAAAQASVQSMDLENENYGGLMYKRDDLVYYYCSFLRGCGQAFGWLVDDATRAKCHKFGRHYTSVKPPGLPDVRWSAMYMAKNIAETRNWADPTFKVALDMAKEELPKLEKKHMACSHCGAAPAPGGTQLLACARCKRARYCNRDCQKAHWRTHKQVCGQAAEDRTNGVEDLMGACQYVSALHPPGQAVLLG